MKKISVLCAALFGATLLSACGSKTDPSEKNFAGALTQYYEKKGELCLHLTNWPVDLTKTDLELAKSMPGGTAGEMAALEAIGLVKDVDTELPMKDLFGKPLKATYQVKRYTLTDAAKPFYREKEVQNFTLSGPKKEMQGDLCWGQMAVDKVVKWDGPMKLGDYQETSVTYTYKIDKMADWVKRPEFQQAFQGVKSTIEGAGTNELKHSIKLTSQGWEALGLD